MRFARRRRPRPAPPVPQPFALYMGKLAPNKGTRHLLAAVDRAAAALAARGHRRRPRSADGRTVGARSRTRHPADRLAAARRGARLAGGRRRAGLPVARAGVAQPRPARGRARSAFRSRRWTRAARATSSSRTAPACSRRVRRRSATIVARLVADRALAARLGRAAREHVEAHFAATAVVARIEGVYREAVASHG